MAYRRRILGRRRLIYKASFTPLAKEDKKEIKMYLSNFYPETPKRFSSALRKHIFNIKENPYMYPIYSENPNYRRMIVDNYIVLYQIIEEVKEIKISRILRASWDLPKYI